MIRQVFWIIKELFKKRIILESTYVDDMFSTSQYEDTMFWVKSVDWKLLLTILTIAHIGQFFSQQSWWISCADKKEKTKDDTKIKALIIIVNILVFTSKKIVLLS